MFSEAQTKHLTAPLDKGVVRTRKQAGREVSYIEGWHAIAEANRIFGFGKWDRQTELSRLGEPREVDGKFRVSFMAKVTITVRPDDETAAHPVTRDGVGYGSGIAKDLGDAHESAIKEAETDAMKRALMTFGNPFGLALYDKDQRNVTDGKQEAREIYAEIERFIRDTEDPETLRAGMEDFGWLENDIAPTSPIDKVQRAHAPSVKKLVSAFNERLKTMNQKDAA